MIGNAHLLEPDLMSLHRLPDLRQQQAGGGRLAGSLERAVEGDGMQHLTRSCRLAAHHPDRSLGRQALRRQPMSWPQHRSLRLLDPVAWLHAPRPGWTTGFPQVHRVGCSMRRGLRSFPGPASRTSRLLHLWPNQAAFRQVWRSPSWSTRFRWRLQQGCSAPCGSRSPRPAILVPTTPIQDSQAAIPGGLPSSASLDMPLPPRRTPDAATRFCGTPSSA